VDNLDDWESPGHLLRRLIRSTGVIVTSFTVTEVVRQVFEGLDAKTFLYRSANILKTNKVG
jgi:hypothetical protein